MIYRFVKFVVKVAIRVFFRKIYFYNTDVIKDDTPVIFALNHPTAFIDPLFVATHIRPKTHTMLRGDVFKKPLAAWFLGKIGTIPIFRFRNGFSGLRQNQETFERCYEVLHEGHCISIMSEGSMVHEKRLRTIQKGTAKMAIGAYEKYGDADIEIIPIGINYSNSNQFRSVLMASVTAPIRIADYLEAYEENPRKAILQITRKVSEQLRSQVIHIDDPADDALVNRVLDIHRNNVVTSVWPPVEDTNDLLEREMAIVQQINAMDEAEKQDLQEKTEKYFQQLDAKSLTDRGIAQRQQASILSTLFLIVGAIPFLWGGLTNFLPFFVGKKIATEKTKQIEFFSSVRMGGYLGTYLLQYVVLLIIAAIAGNAYFALLVLATPLIGYFAVLYQDKFKFWMEAIWVKTEDRRYFSEERERIIQNFVF